MLSTTIELKRFGDPEGILRLKEEYLRDVDNRPTEEVTLGLKQKAFRLTMKKLSYDRFRGSSADEVREAAEAALRELHGEIANLLPVEIGEAGRLQQLDVVTTALEVAQLPFEVLEEHEGDVVVTRRVRQPWPPPLTVSGPEPRVLFAWATPKWSATSSRRDDVPYEAHRELLGDVLSDWLDEANPEKTLVEVEHATFDKIREKLADPKHGFTHVLILAHGVYDDEEEAVFLLLEDEDGVRSRHAPAELADLYANKALARPGMLILATCHGGEVDPLEAGGTLGQVLHEAGIPVVLASQLALTQTGSEELVGTFLREVVDGGDPREALRVCRDRLRERSKDTYYDRVALVGYVDLERGFEERLAESKLEIKLKRLKALSKKSVSSPEETWEVLERVRVELQELRDSGTVKDELLEELIGLQASSLKREAQAAWESVGSVASEDQQAKYLERSREALREARGFYREAGRLSRDHHWTAVQSLVLDALAGELGEDRRFDWISAYQASRDDETWGLGSIAELHIIAPLVGEGDVLRDEDVAAFRAFSDAEDGWPMQSLLDQLDRYLGWWAEDEEWLLSDETLDRAHAVYSRFKD